MQSNGQDHKIRVNPQPEWETLQKSIVNEPQDGDISFYGKFLASQLDQTRDYPDPPPLVNLVQGEDNYPLFTRKSLTVFQGKQKSKKTTVLALVVAAIIGFVKSEDPVRFEAVVDGTVLFFDCEQGESYAARTMKLILRLAGLETSEKLIYADLREHSPSDRMKIIQAAVEGTPNVILVVVDGVVDLMNDFMDSKEGHTVITDLLRLSSQFDLHVTIVIHQNKGGSRDARAHVGSISSQKCEREIMVEVDQEDRAQSVVVCKESRGMPFQDFAIRWDKGSLPCIVQEYVPGNGNHQEGYKKPGVRSVQGPGDIDELTHREILSTVFSQDRQPKYKDLYECLRLTFLDKGHNLGKTKIELFIKWYRNNSWIKQEGKEGTKYSYYVLS